MDEDGGLLNIEINSSDEANSPSKQSRDHQSEENFGRQKASWKPKIEHGQIWKSLSLPINNPSKAESQAILHAIEELYFLASYEEAESLTSKALEGQLQEDFKTTLDKYLARCRANLSQPNPRKDVLGRSQAT